MVVYARGAIVTRRVEVPAVDDGDVEVVVPGITALSEAGSVAARVTGEHRSVVSVHSAPFVPGEVVGIASSDALAHQLRERLERARSERELLERRRARFAALTLQPGLAPRAHGHKVAARTQDALVAHTIADESIAALDERIALLDPAIRALEEELQAAEVARTWASAGERTPSGQPTRVVTVRLTGRGPIGELEVDYAVGAARWWPTYTLELTDRGSSCTLWLEAQVAQASGEDWRDVALSLSTSDLVTDARLPELRSVRYGKPRPPRRAGYRPPPDGLDRLFAGWEVAYQSIVVRQEVRISQVVAKPVAPSMAREKSREVALADKADDVEEVGEADEGTGEDAPMEAELDGAPVRAPTAPPQGVRMQSLGRGGGGAPPPAPSVSYAMSSEAPKGAPRMRSMMMAGPVFGGAPAPKDSTEGGSADELVLGADGASGHEPESAWLDFDRLRLAGPSDRAHRGRLRVASGSDEEGAAVLRARAGFTMAACVPGPACVDVMESRGHYDYRWDALAQAQVPSDGRTHRVRVESYAARPRFRFWAVPLEVAEVFREAALDNPTPGPLLRGPVDVYVDGSLLTTAPLPHVDRGGVVRVGLGVEERLKIARNVRVAEDSAGLLGGSTAVDHHVSIEVRSSVGAPAVVEVYDRVPITEDKSLDIRVVSQQPAGEAYDQVDRGAPIKGGLRWKLPLEAGAKGEIKLHYRLTMSNKSEVVGGNRRD